VRPVDRLAGQAAAMDAASLRRRFELADAPIELLPILRQLNGLLDRVEDAFQRERRFTGAAAHELSTPISELRALAENAIRFPDDAEATARFAADAFEVSRRMERLVNVLLALARCESGRQSLAFEKLRLSEALEDLRQKFEARRCARKLEWTWKVPAGVDLWTDRTLCESVLSNLFDNAVEHAPSGGQIACELASEPEQLRLIVSNTQSDLDPRDLPHLFEPFWRKDGARTDGRHTGLGLTLARSAAHRLGLVLEAQLSPPGWITVVVRFPQNASGDGKLPVTLDRLD
jgi:two-component system sensor histidine kinase QseC